MNRLAPLTLALLCAIAFTSNVSRATSPYLVTLPPETLAQTPAHLYANMSDEEVTAELDRRGVPYAATEPVEGVRTPVRLTGPLHGVHVHSVLPPEQRALSKFEILDARLALALDDFCALLERHDIVELVHYTMYRPNAPPPGAPKVAKKAPRRKGKSLGKGTLRGKPRASSDEPRGRKQKAARTKKKKGNAPAAKKRARSKPQAKRPTKQKAPKKLRWAPPGTRHPAGLAIDAGSFKKRDGRWLVVGIHFRGKLGARTCGPKAEPPDTPEGQELWSIVCEAQDAGLFTYVLTPNYDRAHADHFHMEIRGDVPWRLYH